MCITGSFLLLLKCVQLASFLKQNKHPQKYFRLRREKRQKTNPRNVHNWRPFESSQTCSHESKFAIPRLVFFFREIFPKLFPPEAGKIIGGRREPQHGVF